MIVQANACAIFGERHANANRVRLHTAVYGKVESEDSILPIWPLQDLRVPQGVDGVVVTGFPMLPHRSAGEFVILGCAFIFP